MGHIFDAEHAFPRYIKSRILLLVQLMLLPRVPVFPRGRLRRSPVWAAQMAVAAEEGDTDGLAALVEEDQTMLHAVRLGSAIELELLG